MLSNEMIKAKNIDDAWLKLFSLIKENKSKAFLNVVENLDIFSS